MGIIRGLISVGVVALLLAGCGQTYNTTTTTTFTIYGPFAECTSIFLPGGRAVTYGERDVIGGREKVQGA